MDQARIDRLRRFHTAGQPETIMGWSQANDAIQECLDTIERLQKVADERGESFARSIDDFNNMRDQRDAALAEVETAREASDRVIEHLNQRIGELQGQIELWKDMTGKARIETALKERIGR